MAQVLDGTLATAQDGIDRHPLVEIVSSKFTAEIPMVGQGLTGAISGEQTPKAITLSTGALAMAFVNGDVWTGDTAGTGFSYVYTNPERTQFITVPFDVAGVWNAALVEMADGNIGVVLNMDTSIEYRILSPTGEQIATGVIASGVADWIWGPSVILRQDGNYMLATIEVDGGDYAFIFYTSPDFISWSGNYDAVLPGIDDGLPKNDPFLFQADDGQLSLLISYSEIVSGDNELSNIYHFVSDDNGATWSPGDGGTGKVTDFTDFSTIAYGPAAVSKGAGAYLFSFYKQVSALHANRDTLEWIGNPDSSAGPDKVDGIYFNPVTRKLYVTNYGNDKLGGIIVFDVDTWSVDKAINPDSVPTLSDYWWNGLPGGQLMEFGTIRVTGGPLIPVIGGTGGHIALYDTETDTVTEFHFSDVPSFFLTKNIDGLPTFDIFGLTVELTLRRAYLDYENMRLYLLWAGGINPNAAMAVGYIDLTQGGPSYTYTEIFKETFAEAPSVIQLAGLNDGYSDFWVLPGDNMMIITGGQSIIDNWTGFTRTYTLDGELIHHYDNAADNTYPYRGIKCCVRVGDYLYGTFTYDPNYWDVDKRGLVRVSLLDHSVVVTPLPVEVEDDYFLQRVETNAAGTELYITSGGYGVFIYTIATDTWERFTNDTYPGLFPNDEDQSGYAIRYDETTRMIYVGSRNYWQGLLGFSRDGMIRQTQYLQANKGGSTWSYGAYAPLVRGWNDFQAVLANNPDTGGTYVFWVQETPDGTTILWDQDSGSVSLSDFLLGGSVVSVKRSIDGTPNKLSFTVTHGHLFDPHNAQSLLSPFLQKYRKITVRFGGRIAGADYWHPAGTFVVTGSKMSYQRGTYPTLTVEAEDKRTWWGDMSIVATDHYEDAPDQILSDILQSFAGLTAGEIDLPTFEGSYDLWFQWLDSTVKKIVDTLCNRFGYFPVIDVNDIFTVRRIARDNEVDHTYPDTVFIVSYSPDDSFSDFTNRVVVAGESRTFMEVMYAEEPVGQLAGTAGWWIVKKDFEVWFSDDHMRRCRYPRLEVLESISNMTFIGGGGGESITFIDPEENYCIVTIEVPPAALATAIASIASVIAIGFVCGTSTNVSGYCFYGFVFALSACLYSISLVGNFQYQIHARPFGKQRLGVQGEADDLDLQTLIGRVVEKKIDDPLCITTEQCQWVAEHELMIAMLQRRRLTFEKIAHLQDEEGDTIVIPHPHTGAAMTVFITDIERKFQVPDARGGSGGFTDSVTGWVL